MALDPEGSRRLPALVEVTDEDVAERLRAHLPSWPVTVRVVRRLSPFEDVVRDTQRAMPGPYADAPGLLESGIDLERIRSFACAAADFYRARPWRHLGPYDRVVVRSPAPARDLKAFTVFGASDSPPGLLFIDERAFESRRGPAPDPWTLTFGPLSWLPVADAELWVEHALARADLDACPAVARTRRRRAERPDAAGLAFMEGILRALAETTEDEIDAGEWKKSVRTADGARVIAFAIPELLEPIEVGAEDSVTQDGFDHRAMERLTAGLHQLLAEHEFESVDQINEFLRRDMQGRKIEPKVSDTPLARAQDLAYQAFHARGRRRVQLARRALEISPDCADAHVIRAEALREASDFEGALELYNQGIAAGLRAVSGELLHEAGGLWGHLEVRPYLRSIAGAAECLEEMGRADESLALWRELLRLNPGDNQGARYPILRLLLELRRDDEAWDHVEAHGSDGALVWSWSRALLAYRRWGDGEVSREALDAALRRSAQVGKRLLRDAPDESVDGDFSPGTPEEAGACAEILREPWQATEGAREWLAERLRTRRERNRGERKKRPGKGRTKGRPKKR